jgi:two-component system sensor histidine kinase DegS
MVWDDGRGFDPGASRTRNSGYGLTTMLERAKMLGGTLIIESSPGQGTKLVVELPVIENLYIEPVDSQGSE